MASGESLLTFEPYCAEGQYSSDWYLDTLSPGKPTSIYYSSHYISREYLFIGTQNSVVYFTGILPQHYSGGGLKIKIYYGTLDNNSNGYTWSAETITLNVAFDRIGDGSGNLDSLTFGSSKFVSETPPSNYYVQKTELDFSDGTEIDNLQKGELFVMKFYFSATDTSMDCNIHKIVIEEI